jgi:hypothetical protein
MMDKEKFVSKLNDSDLEKSDSIAPSSDEAQDGEKIEYKLPPKSSKWKGVTVRDNCIQIDESFLKVGDN